MQPYGWSFTLNQGESMKLYKNLSGNSGVKAFEIGLDFIRIQFHDGPVYLYTYQSASPDSVDKLKQLAKAGKGLSTFLNQHPLVRRGYVR